MAPPAPATKREMKISAISHCGEMRAIAHSEQARARRRKATVAMLMPNISVGRRPRRSESLPQNGETRSCASAKTETISPMRNGEAPSRLA